MIKLLLKVQIRSVFARKSADAKKKKKGLSALSTGGMIVLVAFLALTFLGLFAGMFYPLAEPLFLAGFGWFYFALAAILALTVSLFCTVFYAQPQIYGAKDNDLLLSMPIKPSAILISRLIVLYLEALLTALIVLLPAGVIWCIYCTVSVFGVIFFVILTLLLGALSTAVALALGAMIAWIMARFKRKNLLTAIGMILFSVLYFKGLDMIEVLIEGLIVNPSLYADGIRGFLYPFYVFGVAVAEKNVGMGLLFAAIALLPAILVCVILAKTFIGLITTKRGEAKIKYRRKEMKVSSPLSAFTKKELRHLVFNFTYLMNAAMGVVMMPILAVMLLVSRGEIELLLAQIPGSSEYAMMFLPLIVCFAASTVMISAATVSIEGKNLWIAQSSPCDPGTILVSKALSHIVVTCPGALLASLILLPMTTDVFSAVSLVAIPQLFVAFGAFFGVSLNLWMPKMNYENEVAAIKRGTPTILLMLSGMALCVVMPALTFGLGLSPYLSMTVYTALLIVLNVAFCSYLRTRGGRRFAAL